MNVAVGALVRGIPEDDPETDMSSRTTLLAFIPCAFSIRTSIPSATERIRLELAA